MSKLFQARIDDRAHDAIQSACADYGKLPSEVVNDLWELWGQKLLELYAQQAALKQKAAG